jgi:hypothetical protein
MFCRFGLGIVEDLEQDGDPEDFFRNFTWYCVPWYVFRTEMKDVGETAEKAQDGSEGIMPLATFPSDVGVIWMGVC